MASPVTQDLGALTLGDSQEDTVNFAPQDRAGNTVAATVTGVCDTPAALTITMAGDSSSATILANAGQKPGGPYVVTFTGTNPDGSPAGVATVEVTVVTEAANSLNATLGTVSEQP